MSTDELAAIRERDAACKHWLQATRDRRTLLRMLDALQEMSAERDSSIDRLVEHLGALQRENEALRNALNGVRGGDVDGPCFCAPGWLDRWNEVHSPRCIAARAALEANA